MTSTVAQVYPFRPLRRKSALAETANLHHPSTVRALWFGDEEKPRESTPSPLAWTRNHSEPRRRPKRPRKLEVCRSEPVLTWNMLSPTVSEELDSPARSDMSDTPGKPPLLRQSHVKKISPTFSLVPSARSPPEAPPQTEEKPTVVATEARRAANQQERKSSSPKASPRSSGPEEKKVADEASCVVMFDHGSRSDFNNSKDDRLAQVKLTKKLPASRVIYVMLYSNVKLPAILLTHPNGNSLTSTADILPLIGCPAVYAGNSLKFIPLRTYEHLQKYTENHQASECFRKCHTHLFEKGERFGIQVLSYGSKINWSLPNYSRVKQALKLLPYYKTLNALSSTREELRASQQREKAHSAPPAPMKQRQQQKQLVRRASICGGVKLSKVLPPADKKLHGLPYKGSFSTWFSAIPPDYCFDQDFVCEQGILTRDNFQSEAILDIYLCISEQV